VLVAVTDDVVEVGVVEVSLAVVVLAVAEVVLSVEVKVVPVAVFEVPVAVVVLLVAELVVPVTDVVLTVAEVVLFVFVVELPVAVVELAVMVVVESVAVVVLPVAVVVLSVVVVLVSVVLLPVAVMEVPETVVMVAVVVETVTVVSVTEVVVTVAEVVVTVAEVVLSVTDVSVTVVEDNVMLLVVNETDVDVDDGQVQLSKRPVLESVTIPCSSAVPRLRFVAPCSAGSRLVLFSQMPHKFGHAKEVTRPTRRSSQSLNTRSAQAGSSCNVLHGSESAQGRYASRSCAGAPTTKKINVNSSIAKANECIAEYCTALCRRPTYELIEKPIAITHDNQRRNPGSIQWRRCVAHTGMFHAGGQVQRHA
jgi:hypothetical protein